MSEQGVQRSRPGTIRLLWLLTIVFCVLLVTNWWPWLRGDVPWLPGDIGWRWTLEAPRWLWLIPCIAGVILYTFGAIHLLNRTERDPDEKFPLHLILWTFVGAALLPLLLLTLEGRPLFLLFTRSASTVTGGFQVSATMVTDLNDTLRNWPEFIAAYQSQNPHGGIALSPPGLTSLFFGFTQLFNTIPSAATVADSLVRPLECQNLLLMSWTDAQMASVWPQIFMPIWVALSIAPLYKLGRMLFSRSVALWAIVCWPLIPSLNIFTPRFNTFYALMTLVLLVFLWRGLLRNRPLEIVLAGFIASVGTFMNLAVVPLGVIGGLTILGYWWYSRHRIQAVVINMLLFGIGSASVWVIYWVLSGISPLTVIGLGLSTHYQLERPYVPWLFMHTYDTFLFFGLPLTVLALVHTWQLFKANQLRTLGGTFTLVGWATLIIMVLSGTARGETGRVWLFFAPLWILIGAQMALSLNVPQRRSILYMQAFYLLMLAAFIRGNFTALTVPPSPPTADRAPTFVLNNQFVLGNDKLTLVGLDVDKSPSEATLHLYWRADTFIKRPYFVSIVPVPPDKTSIPGISTNPEKWHYPPSCWLPGQVFVDDETVSFGDKAQVGNWLFSLNITDFYSHQKMAVIGQESAQVGIGPVSIP